MTGPATVFLDKRVFQLDYVPERILHRDDQISRIREILHDLDLGVTPRHILGIGDFGTGKTAVFRSTCRNLPAGIATVYINCSDHNTQTRIYKKVLQDLGVEIKLGFPGDYYLEQFKKAAAKVKFLILILDETDKYVERDDSDVESLLYTVSRTITNVMVIMLTNHASLEARLLTTLDSRVLDTFRWKRLEFGDYNAQELGNILADRCRIGLRDGTYDAGIIAMIARIAFRRGLRARGVIDLTREAVGIAEANGHNTIQEDDVRQAEQESLRDQEMAIVRHLPPPQRAILAFVLVQSPTLATIQEWWAGWAAENDFGQGRTTLHGYVKELETMSLIDRQTRGLGRRRSTVTTLTVPSDLTRIVSNSLRETSQPPPTPQGLTT